MVSVYELRGQDDYQALDAVDFEEFRKEWDQSWKFDGTPVANIWKPLEMYVRQTNLKKPDIWAIANTFAFERAAAKVVQLPLDQSAEQLILPFDGRKLVVANVTYVIDCLDKEKSIYDPDLPHLIEKYVFHLKRLDYSLFKIPQHPGIILTVEGLASPDDEFKPLVERHGLKGLYFEKLWSD
jgi:hypothetical protein